MKIGFLINELCWKNSQLDFDMIFEIVALVFTSVSEGFPHVSTIWLISSTVFFLHVANI